VPRGKLAPHRQIAAWLAARIEAGDFGPDDPLPSEKDLQAMFGVARETARRAVKYLASEGLIVVIPGRGSYVKQPDS
jgi:DNA-binding GntR family transcriptional regulator